MKWLGLAMVLGLQVTSAAGVIIMQDFLDSPGKLELDSRQWSLADGVLSSVDGVGRMVSFSFGSPDWADCEVEFKLRRLRVAPGDQHFGLILRSDGPGAVQVYCRGESLIYKAGTGHALLGMLKTPLSSGPDASWTAFRFVLSGQSLQVYADGVEVGRLDGLGPAPGKLSFYVYHLDAAVKDLKVIVTKVVTPPSPRHADSKNILHNSGFEQCSLDLLPDYWGSPHWGLADAYWATRFEEWQERFGVDDSVAYEGKRSMRIDNPFDKPSSGLTLWSVCARAEQDTPYTLSAYLRSEPDGLKVKLGKEIFIVDGQWRRYVTSFQKDSNSLYKDMVMITPQDKGTVWIDAVQLEKGDVTPYQPMANETQALETEEGNVEKVLSEVPKFRLPRLKGSPVFDGRLDDPFWDSIPRLELLTISGEETKAPTEARIGYTEEGLWLGVMCHDPEAGKNRCGVTARDGNVWNDPSLELFIDPQLSRNYYFHLALNQCGVRYDGFCGDMSWNGDWQAATFTDPDGKWWSAEIFLPFAELGLDPTAGEWWGFNLCRENHSLNEYSCWSPTYGGFHTPVRFGQIAVDTVVQEPYHVGCRNARLRRLSAGRAALTVKLHNASGRDQNYAMSARVLDAKGDELAHFAKEVELEKGAERSVDLGELACPEEARLRLALELRADGILRHSATVDLETPETLTVQAQYDVYTEEKELQARVQVNLGAEALTASRLRLVLRDSSGTELAARECSGPAAHEELAFDIASLPVGEYRLDAELTEGSEDFRASKAFRKLPPVGNVAKADHFSRMMTVDGKPFLPFGIALEGNSTEECLRYYAAHGITSVVVVASFKDRASAGRFLDCAAEVGIKVWYHLHSPRDEAARQKVADFMTAFKNHPALLAWSPFDEIFTIAWGKENYPAVAEECAACKTIDPYHPVFVNENSYGLSFLKNEKLDFPGDVVSIDYYAFPPSRSLQLVSRYARDMAEMGARDSKPTWIYLFGGGYTFWAGRDLTPDEQEFETYAAIVNGIRGLYYFADHPKSRSHWERLVGLAGEVQTLTPILASTEAVPQIACNRPEIEFLAKKFDNKLYLIAVSHASEPVEARFDLSGIHDAGKTATILFEGRKVKVKGNLLSDRFEPLRRHVYVIDCGGSLLDFLLPW